MLKNTHIQQTEMWQHLTLGATTVLLLVYDNWQHKEANKTFGNNFGTEEIEVSK